MEGRGGSENFMGGAHFFLNLKGGSHFFPEFNIKYFLKKVCSIRNQSASCTTEPLFVSLSNTDLQIFCFYIATQFKTRRSRTELN